MDELMQITQREGTGEPLVAFMKHVEKGGRKTSVELVGRSTRRVVETRRREQRHPGGGQLAFGLEDGRIGKCLV